MARGFLPKFPAPSDPFSEKGWQSDLNNYALASHSFAPVQTANFTCSTIVFGYPCDTTAASITATLPPATSYLGKPYYFRNAAGANSLIIAANGSDLIMGLATITLAAGEDAMLFCNGSNWWFRQNGFGGGGGGDMFRANNLSDVINTSTSYSNLTFLNTGTGAVARGGRVKMQEVAVSVKDFGAVADNVTDDTAAIQAAIDYVSSIGGGDVLFPVGRYMTTGTLGLKVNVNLVGMKEGPFGFYGDPNSFTFAPTIQITNTVTNFILQTRVAGRNGNNHIKNLLFHYPNQRAGNSTSAPIVYPWTIFLPQGDCDISQCTFANSYDAIFVNNGRCNIRNCLVAGIHWGIHFDRAIDYCMVSDVYFLPGWDYFKGLAPFQSAHPNNIDTWQTTNDTRGISLLRADAIQLSNIGIFGQFKYGIYMDDGNYTDPITFVNTPGPSYGNMANIDVDSALWGIYAKSTLASAGGWSIANLTLGVGLAGTGKGIELPVGGTDTPRLNIHGGSFRSATVNPYLVSRGYLNIQGMDNIDMPGGVLTAPGFPASTVAVTNPFPYAVCVYINNNGGVTDVHVNGTATGGIRGTVTIPSAGTISVTYGAPTPNWTWFKQN